MIPLAGRLAVEWRAACGFRASWVCCMGGCPPSIPARVAKLADAPDLGSGGCKPLGGRLPPLAPTWSVAERGASVKVEVEAIEGCKRRLAVEAPADVVQKEWERAYVRIGRASCRERSVDLGGRRIIKKKKKRKW